MADKPDIEKTEQIEVTEPADQAAADAASSDAPPQPASDAAREESPRERTELPPRGTEPLRSKVTKRKRKHKKKNYILRAVIVLAIIAAAVCCAHLSYFNVNNIAVIGNEEVSDEEIIKLSELKTGGSVFDVHPLLIQHKIKKNLYIDKVNVNRVLPDKVEIIVKERNLLLQFHKDAKFVITDEKGMVVDVSKEEKKATVIEGVTVTGAEKKETIQLKEKGKLDKVLDLITATDENDLFFKRIVFRGGKVDAYVYDNLKCSGKYDNLMSAISSGVLKKVIYDLYQKGTEKGTVNVYNNDYCFFTPN